MSKKDAQGEVELLSLIDGGQVWHHSLFDFSPPRNARLRIRSMIGERAVISTMSTIRNEELRKHKPSFLKVLHTPSERIDRTDDLHVLVRGLPT